MNTPSEQLSHSNMKFEKRSKQEQMNDQGRIRQKKSKIDYFDRLPDEIVFIILYMLCIIAASPSDLIAVTLTCKRLYDLGLPSSILSRASWKCFPLNAQRWCEPAHRFLKLMADAGNIEANYTLGMIQYYCLGERKSGLTYMGKAAEKLHSLAQFSKALIHLHTHIGLGLAYLKSAIQLGNLDAMRELGYIYENRYGNIRNIDLANYMLFKAECYELALDIYRCRFPGVGLVTGPHPVNHFMVEWFKLRVPGDGLKVCSNKQCGRPELNRGQFFWCVMCNMVFYCSRVCRAYDWKAGHNEDCEHLGMLD